MVMFLKAKPLL